MSELYFFRVFLNCQNSAFPFQREGQVEAGVTTTRTHTVEEKEEEAKGLGVSISGTQNTGQHLSQPIYYVSHGSHTSAHSHIFAGKP